MKTIDYYMSLPYKIELYPDVEEGGYAIACPELPGCLSCGGCDGYCTSNSREQKRICQNYSRKMVVYDERYT